jgi:hypothetical protein
MKISLPVEGGHVADGSLLVGLRRRLVIKDSLMWG